MRNAPLPAAIASLIGLSVAGLSPLAAVTSPAPPASADCAVLPRPAMRARLVVERGVPADVGAEVQATVTMVWRGEGLALTWLPEAPPGQADRTTNFWLRVLARPLDGSGRQDEPALGVVRFTGALPRQDVLVSYGAARDWARRERDRRFRVLFGGMTRLESLEFGGFDRLARRALGYAAAHEVGHFVLASKTHDARGLMRRDLVARTVERVEHRDLRLSDASRRQLADRFALAAACPLSPAVPQ